MTTGKTIHDVIIVGGGHNGLVCASYLAKAGLDVLILERRHLVGGACVTEELFSGYQISTYAYIVYILQDRVIQDLNLHKYGYKVHPLIAKRFFPSVDTPRSFMLWNDTERTCAEIERKFSKEDALGYARWQAFWYPVAELFNQYFLTEPPTLAELQEHVRGTDREVLVDRLLNGTLAELLDEFFVTDEVKGAAICHMITNKTVDQPGGLFTHAASRPNILTDRYNQGIPEGGMGMVTQCLAKAAEDAGVKIRCGAEVKQILLDDNGQATGVELVDGQVLRSRLVVSNADPKRTFLNLIGEDKLPREVVTPVQNLETACATIKFHAVLSEMPDFRHHFDNGEYDPRYIADVGICPSFEYYRQSLQDTAMGKITDSLICDIQIPTVYDDTIAPPGHHIASAWASFVPVNPVDTDWTAERDRIGQLLIDRFTELAPNFRRSLVDWLVYTPKDIEQRVYLTDGNFRHTDHAPNQLLAHRLFPENGSRGGHRTPVTGLYMCGAGTHPGGDVSGAPGYNAAQAVLADWATKN